MNEQGLQEVLAMLCDAAGLTQPREFVHTNLNCYGQVMDQGQFWRCVVCYAQAWKGPRNTAAHTFNSQFETQRTPSPQANSFVQSKIGYPNFYPPPIFVSTPSPSPVGAPAPVKEHFMVDIDQDLEKYTKVL